MVANLFNPTILYTIIAFHRVPLNKNFMILGALRTTNENLIILLTKITVTQNEAALSYHGVRG